VSPDRPDLDEYAGPLSHASRTRPHGMVRIAVDDIARLGAALDGEQALAADREGGE